MEFINVFVENVKWVVLRPTSSSKPLVITPLVLTQKYTQSATRQEDLKQLTEAANRVAVAVRALVLVIKDLWLLDEDLPIIPHVIQQQHVVSVL